MSDNPYCISRIQIVYPYIIIHFHWPNISIQCVLRAYMRSVPQHSPFHSDYRLYGALWCPILVWGSSPTKPYNFLILQQLIHKLWGIEDNIICLLSLDRHSLNFILPLKGEFFFDSYSSVYGHLVIHSHITTGMVKKNRSSREQHICIWLILCVVEPNWSLIDIVICRHHMFRQNIILLDILLICRILIDCIYFIGSKMTLSRLKVVTLGALTVGHCLGIFFHLQTPCTN